MTGAAWIASTPAPASRLAAAFQLLLLLLLASPAHSEWGAECQAGDVVTLEFAITAPPGSESTAGLFVAGNLAELGGWRPDGLALVRGEDGLHHAKLAVAKDAALEFKITRGSWATVEKSAAGQELPNRRHVAIADATLSITVAAWADAAGRVGNVTGTVERIDGCGAGVAEGFGAKSDLLPRAIHVWLPPGYAAHPELRCAVLYMQDGQNLFDDARGFGGNEWHVDETCDRLVRAGVIPPLIVVGIENTRARMAEYTPTADAKHAGGGRADAYARLLIDEVKPFVDARYRTRPEREQTFVAGSSLGGLVSLYLLHEHPDVFGGAAALSPAIDWDRGWLQREWARAPPQRPVRLWIDMGTREGDVGRASAEEAEARTGSWIASMRAFAALLEEQGLRRDRDFAAREYEGARHNEAAWAARFEDVARFLLGPVPAAAGPDGEDPR